MYFKVPKESDTGKKFAEVIKKGEAARKAANAFAKKHGAIEYYSDPWKVFGGLSALVLKNPDLKIWRKIVRLENGYVPRKSSKEGKKIEKEMRALPYVGREEANLCIGFKGAPWKVIGISWNNPDFFGFSIQEDWDINIPSDCIEVTTTEYNTIFKS